MGAEQVEANMQAQHSNRCTLDKNSRSPPPWKGLDSKIYSRTCRNLMGVRQLWECFSSNLRT